MRFTTIGRNIAASSQIASTREICAAFSDHRMELTWLAEFLSDDALMASACVTDALNLIENTNSNNDDFFQEHLLMGPMEVIVLSVLNFKRRRIAELSSAYECFDLFSRENPTMSLEMMQLVVTESDLFRSRLDCLCRFVLVWCGFAQNSASHAALLLGISTRAVEAA
jgi:hypothetical protein